MFEVTIKKTRKKQKRFKITAGTQEEAEEWAKLQRGRFGDEWADAEIKVKDLDPEEAGD